MGGELFGDKTLFGQDHRGSQSATNNINLGCFCDLQTVDWQFLKQRTVSVFTVSVSLSFLPTTLFPSVSSYRLGICKGQVNFLVQEHFARAVEYAINTVDVPCALGSAYLQFLPILRFVMASVGQ